MWTLFGAAYVVGRRRKPRDDLRAPEKVQTPQVYAYLYQLPDDGFTTTRMASGESGKEPREMGVFGTPDAARRVAASKGWALAWDGVRQLQSRPGK
jgi:hypothetical protein